MKLNEIFEESIAVLTTNKMRTLLSILGIVIGIGSVIALMTLGEASQSSVKQQIQSLGSNILTIRPGAQQQGFVRTSNSDNTSLKYTDAEEIKTSQRIDTVNDVAVDYTSRGQIIYDKNNMNVQIYGITDNYLSLRNIKLDYGENISLQDRDIYNKVIVLGAGVVEELFGTEENPIGKFVRISGASFKVIGVTTSKGSTGFGGGSLDESVYVPLETAQKVMFGISHVSTIYVTAKNEEVMDAALNQIGFLLLERHGLATPEEADFSIQSQEDILETVSEITGTFTTLLTGIAAISLVVGGIGIMNIMLVTVTERTTEIGLRKALGAKRKTIVTQFLVEAIILTFTGGLIGILLGIGTSIIITKLMNLPATLSLSSIGLSVVMSSLVGIVFGWYPAQKASKLEPIVALRYE